MNELDLQRIRLYLDNELSESKFKTYFYQNGLFKQLSFARNTVFEIINRIMERPYISAYDTVFEFWVEIKGRSYSSTTRKTYRTLCVMEKTILDVLSLL